MAKAFRPCSVNDCKGDASQNGTARGYCINHYRRWQKYGDPTGGRAPPGEALRFIEEIAVPYAQEECLTWPFSTDGKGYGVVSIGGVQHGAHRVVCIKAHGEPPRSDMEVAHSCGNGHLGCVAPGHLRWDTRLANSSDRVRHGRSPRGETHGANKLSESDVRLIRSLRGSERQVDIAARFGVSQHLVSAIIRRKKWAWLE